jgi:hypothetical protein
MVKHCSATVRDATTARRERSALIIDAHPWEGILKASRSDTLRTRLVSVFPALSDFLPESLTP